MHFRIEDVCKESYSKTVVHFKYLCMAVWKKGYGFMNFKCLYVINGISGFRDRFVSTQSYIFIISKIISILPNVNFCKWCGLLSARFCPRWYQKKKKRNKKNRIRLDNSIVTWYGPPDLQVRFRSGSENVENQSDLSI